MHTLIGWFLAASAIRSHCSTRVDHDHDRFAQLIILGEINNSVAIDGWIGQQYVLNPRAGEPDGLGKGIGQSALIAALVQHPVDDGPASDRLGR